MVAAQWDRPLMRRGRACKTLRDLGGRRSKADRLGRKYNLALSRPTSRLHGRLACRSHQRHCARLMDCGQMGARDLKSSKPITCPEFGAVYAIGNSGERALLSLSKIISGHRDEHLGKGWLLMEDADHSRLLQPHDLAIRDCRCGR